MLEFVQEALPAHLIFILQYTIVALHKENTVGLSVWCIAEYAYCITKIKEV